MPDGSKFVYHLTNDAAHAKQIREMMKESRKVPKRPNPDTFLGRKTQEPFPNEDDEEARMMGWLSSKELQPPK